MRRGNETYPCMLCPMGETMPTGQCNKCGAVYKRGALVKEGAIRKPVPIKSRAAKSKQPDLINFDQLPFVSYQFGKTREEAIQNMFDFYDAHPGRRRLPASRVYEVLGVTREITTASKTKGGGMWVIRLQRISNRTPATATPSVEKPKPASKSSSSYEGKRGRHPADCTCSKHGGRSS